MALKQKIPDLKEIQKRFDKCFDFNQKIGLYDTVQINEDFFIGNQWNGIKDNGLPTPVFNFLKQVVLFQVATITSDNLTLQATPMPSASGFTTKELEQYAEIVSHQYAAIIERNRIVTKLREFLRNAAVDGDSCMFFHFDPSVENGQRVKGEIEAEIIENTRVHFGNPNCRDVQRQPYIIISRRELVEDVQWRAEQLKKSGQNSIEDVESIQPDSEKWQNRYDSYTDDKVTVLTYLYRSRETGTIWCIEATEKEIIREAYDTEYTMYPLIWINWDYIHDCYHGQSMITGLMPNQKFVNKMFAMVGISLLTQAFPKTVYDATRIKRWDGGVGQAIGVNGNVDNVAKTIEGAAVNPQIAQFMELCIQKTRSFLGASDVAMGDSRPDNTSAIIALQRASNTPMELTKQNLYQCVEDMGRIFLDIMSVRYGTRTVEFTQKLGNENQPVPLGMNISDAKVMEEFDFGILKKVRFGVKQDVGASSYWSEIANMQTLDNLLMNKHINAVQYLERMPNGYIAKKEALIAELKGQTMGGTAPLSGGTGMSVATTSKDTQLPVGSGNSALQRALNREGA
jgi:hypothetical protein